jgi:hypothetical protein
MQTNNLTDQSGFSEENISKKSHRKKIHPWYFPIIIVSFLLGLLTNHEPGLHSEG